METMLFKIYLYCLSIFLFRNKITKLKKNKIEHDDKMKSQI